MGDPRVTERDNPLVRRLNQVARANLELGTPLGMAGAGPGIVDGGSARVLPPPPRPMTPEEAPLLAPRDALELEEEWLRDPTNPANRGAAGEMAPAPAGLWTPPPRPTATVQYKFAIDLEAGTIIVNGATMPLPKKEVKRFRELAMKSAKYAAAYMVKQQLSLMQTAFKTPSKKGVTSERTVETPVAIEKPAEGPAIRPRIRAKVVREKPRKKARSAPPISANVEGKGDSSPSTGGVTL